MNNLIRYVATPVATIIVALITTWGTIHVAGGNINEAQKTAETAKKDARGQQGSVLESRRFARLDGEAHAESTDAS
jgi:hypothetical protein